MSKVEQLIQELCPGGVDDVTFFDACDLIRGITYNKNQEAKTPHNAHKVLRANNITLHLNSLNFEDVKLVSKDVVIKPEQHLYSGDILMCAGSGSKEHVGKVAYISEDINYTFGGFMAVVRCKPCLHPRFMFHILTSNIFSIHLEREINSTTINNINKQVMQSLKIPLPPLPIQQEIVRILDTFTEAQANLEQELELRKKQYEYYRNQLLTFDENDPSVKWMTLGDLGKVCMCKRIMKNQTSDKGEIPFFKIGTFGKIPDAYITKELFEDYKAKYNYPEIGDILISAAGTIGRTVVFDGTPSYFQDSNIVWIRNNGDIVSNNYLKYYYTVAKWEIDNGGVVSRLYNDSLRATKIPVPSKDRQQEIVTILDKFESAIQTLEEELALRKKQYEYYREKLLTFN